MPKTLEYYLSLDYPVEIRRIDDNLGGGYVASIPSLGSYAFVGDGETPQEAYENLQVAKKEIFEEYLREGLPIPEPVAELEYEDYSGKLMLRMPRELHAKLAADAKRNDTSLNQFIVYALSCFEVKWSVVQEVKESLSTTLSTGVAWCGAGSAKPTGRVGVVDSSPPKAFSATVLSRRETTDPAVVVSGQERSASWSSILPSSVTTLTRGTN